MASRKIRVLCLHGYRMNAKVMAAQTQVLRHALSDAAEFVFLDGPYEADGPTDALVQKLFGGTAPFREWCRLRSPGIDGDPTNAHDLAVIREQIGPHNEWYYHYEGVEKAIALIEEMVMSGGPFDVVVGFSQGATMLTLLAAMSLQKHNVRLWNLAICVGGVNVVDLRFRALFEKSEGGERISVPLSSVHIVGKKDPIRLESLKLVKMYEDYPATGSDGRRKIVYEHAGGHKFPPLKGNEKFYEKLVKLIHDQCRAEVQHSSNHELAAKL